MFFIMRSIDLEQLYPYLMADSVGGKTSQEYYYFIGGFSYPLGIEVDDRCGR